MVLCGLSASIFKKKKLPSTPKKKNPAQIQLKTNMNAQDIFLWKEGGGKPKHKTNWLPNCNFAPIKFQPEWTSIPWLEIFC